MADVSNPLGVSKNYWSRPDGKVGMIVPIVAVAAAIWFFGGVIGDFIVNAVDNIFHLILVGTATMALIWILLDSKFRAAVFYLYRSLVRFMVGFLIDLDPIGVLKTYKERMEGKLSEMSDSLSKLKGQRLKTQRLQDGKSKEYENEIRLVEQAKLKGDTRTEALEGKQLVRLRTMLDRYVGDINRMTLLITVLDRYFGLCQDTITDMDREIKYRQDEREYSQSSRSAVRGAMAILKGLPEKDMWDDSLAALEKQYTEAIGEVENFLDVTKGILSQADLQDGADADKAMQLLDDWTKKNSTVNLGGQGNQISKATIIQDAARQLTAAPASITMNTAKPNYSTVPRSGIGTTGTQQAQADGDDYLNLVK